MALQVPCEDFRQGAGPVGAVLNLAAGDGTDSPRGDGFALQTGSHHCTQQVADGAGIGKGPFRQGQAEVCLNAVEQFHSGQTVQTQVVIEGAVKDDRPASALKRMELLR